MVNQSNEKQMTRVKSLGIPESGYPHREHRSKKNRNYIEPKDLNGRRKRKQILEKLKLEDLEDDENY